MRRREATAGLQRRGAAAVEMALLVPLLVGLLFGIADVGDLLVRQGAASSSVRIAAIESFDRAGERTHDHDVAATLVTEMRNRGLADVTRVVIYDATLTDQPPASCVSAAALIDGGVAGTCVVFGPTVLASIAAGTAADRFHDDDCIGDADARWCPSTRLPADPLDGWRVGIWVEARHSSPTGVVPQLRDYDIEDSESEALVVGTRPYHAHASVLGPFVGCWDTTTDGPCAGWSVPLRFDESITSSAWPSHLFPSMDVGGVVNGVCLYGTGLPWEDNVWCLSLDGTTRFNRPDYHAPGV